MEPRVILQAAHQNIQFNAYPRLRGSTGAPGEQRFSISLAVDLAAHLRQLDVNAVTVDANYHADVYDEPADLFLSLHYDSFGETKPRGCRFARGIYDYAGDTSDRMVEILTQTYPRDTGIPLYRDNQASRGMMEYYGFEYCSRETPAVIAELGVGHHPLDRAILCDEDGTARRQITSSLASAVLTFLSGERIDPLPKLAPPAEPLTLPVEGPTDYVKALKWQDGYMNLVQIARDFAHGDLTRLEELNRLEAAYTRVVEGRDVFPDWRE